MKEGIHPKYHPVIFRDVSTGDEIVTRSTLTAKETREVDGVEHYVIDRDITSFTHPFFTGKQKLVDTEGRIDRFRRKYARARQQPGAQKAAETQPAAEAKPEAPAEGGEKAEPSEG